MKKLFFPLLASVIVFSPVALNAEEANAYLGDDEPSSDDTKTDLTGPTKTETITIANSTLIAAGGSSAAAERLLKSQLKKIPYVGSVIGVGGAATALAGYANSSNNGYKITVNMRYGTKEVFDGTHWVDHEGYHITSQTISTY